MFDTIAAIATAPGRGGIGVVRVSGPAASAVAKGFGFGELTARMAKVGLFRDGRGAILDHGVVLYFAGPASFTGEDTLELHGHGGPRVLQEVLARCVELGARLAEPGEFTQRAFLNGKLDLTAAEAVADLIDASSSAAVRAAALSLTGAFAKRIELLREGLVALRVHLEASLDFPEEDVDSLDREWQKETLESLLRDVRTIRQQAVQGRLLREGIRVVLLGAPNVGKSSLLNRLAEDEVAIVSPIPGTTRDPVRADVTIGGVALHLVDTAGLRETVDAVELLGIERTVREVDQACLVLEVLEFGHAFPERTAKSGQVWIQVVNKIDLAGVSPRAEKVENDGMRVFLSAKTGAGLDLLRDTLLSAAGVANVGEGIFMARERHVKALSELECALVAARDVVGCEFQAEELRRAHQWLQSITGEFSADELLGEIFGKFCIGK